MTARDDGPGNEAGPAASRLAEGTLLWTPTADDIAATNLTAYIGWLERQRGLVFGDYEALWRWSVEDLAGFWSSIVDYFDLPLRGDRARVVDDIGMPGSHWYEDAEINYAEAVFARAASDRPALIFQSERDPQRAVSWSELETSVAAVAAGLRRIGVGRGDRVVAIMPNIPETVVAFLACASLGAIWASCSRTSGPAA